MHTGDSMFSISAPWRYATVGIRVLLALIFLVAGGSKVIHPWVFVHTVEAYNMLPNAAARPFGLALPWIELLVGLYLLVGLFTRAAAVAAAALLVLFLVALGTQIARGHTNMSCGCVDWDNPIVKVFAGGDTIGAWDVIRDGLLLLLASALALVPRPPLTVDEWLARRRELVDEEYELASGGG